MTKILCLECKVLWVWCCFAANLFYCLRLPIQFNALGRWPKYYAWNVKWCGVDAASQQTYFIVSSSPSNSILREVTKILCVECKVLWVWCCFAANLFYCLRLPIQFNARGRWQKYYTWNVKCCGVKAASQQTYFIVSGSQSNTMLGEVTRMLCQTIR